MRAAQNDRWTAAADEKLAAYWAQAEPFLSTSRIAEVMGVSKNAVVGRAHRLGLPARPSPIRPRDPNAPPPPPSPARKTSLPSGAMLDVTMGHAACLPVTPPPARYGLDVVDISRARATAAERKSEGKPAARSKPCLWPMGMPREVGFHFCGAGGIPGRPYCAAHDAIAYVRVRKRREDAA